MTGIHATAIVSPEARLGEDVEVGPYCVVGAGVTLGARTFLRAHVVVEGPTDIGADCDIFPFAALGGAPQHAGYRGEPTRLVIGDRNVIREHVTMNRGTPGGRGLTSVGSDGFFMAQCHIGHDCMVGDKVTLAQGATLGGHSQLDDFVILGGAANVHQGNRVGRHAMVGGMSGVNRDVIPFGAAQHNPITLGGLNIVGLRRRGFSRETMHTLRASYRMLFADRGTLQDRIDEVAQSFPTSPEVAEVVRFLRAEDGRAICTPRDR
ncbi:MAG TPA: acyl-ACP--UDP-N-acetylglucosamine O-acyltransferase [Caulobacteraceae bacterium]|jgi:UDP-N-acetylglucosamine acyltransferase